MSVSHTPIATSNGYESDVRAGRVVSKTMAGLKGESLKRGGRLCCCSSTNLDMLIASLDLSFSCSSPSDALEFAAAALDRKLPQPGRRFLPKMNAARRRIAEAQNSTASNASERCNVRLYAQGDPISVDV